MLPEATVSLTSDTIHCFPSLASHSLSTQIITQSVCSPSPTSDTQNMEFTSILSSSPHVHPHLPRQNMYIAPPLHSPNQVDNQSYSGVKVAYSPGALSAPANPCVCSPSVVVCVCSPTTQQQPEPLPTFNFAQVVLPPVSSTNTTANSSPSLSSPQIMGPDIVYNTASPLTFYSVYLPRLHCYFSHITDKKDKSINPRAMHPNMALPPFVFL